MRWKTTKARTSRTCSYCGSAFERNAPHDVGEHRVGFNLVFDHLHTHCRDAYVLNGHRAYALRDAGGLRQQASIT